jgi:hypothetical protein
MYLGVLCAKYMILHLACSADKIANVFNIPRSRVPRCSSSFETYCRVQWPSVTADDVTTIGIRRAKLLGTACKCLWQRDQLISNGTHLMRLPLLLIYSSFWTRLR